MSIPAPNARETAKRLAEIFGEDGVLRFCTKGRDYRLSDYDRAVIIRALTLAERDAVMNGMTAKEAMDIGMEIAERHSKVALDILRVKPDATHEEMLRGTSVWLGAEIMKEICRLIPDESEERPQLAKNALNCALDDLERVTALWREAELMSRDFQMALGRIVYRYRRGLAINKQIEQATDLIARKGTLSVLRDEAD